jgi:hypothetical protein
MTNKLVRTKKHFIFFSSAPRKVAALHITKLAQKYRLIALNIERAGVCINKINFDHTSSPDLKKKAGASKVN